MSGEPSRNIELKARIAELPGARDAVLRLGARDAGVAEQTDTYFYCTTGRLKLRETLGRGAELIAYARPDHVEARVSEYHLVPIDEPGLLKRALSAVLGVRLGVVKRRHLLLWHNVRIHLDEVQGLGSFCEFEAVIGPGDDEAASRERLERLVVALGILPGELIATSYADLAAPPK